MRAPSVEQMAESSFVEPFRNMNAFKAVVLQDLVRRVIIAAVLV